MRAEYGSISTAQARAKGRRLTRDTPAGYVAIGRRDGLVVDLVTGFATADQAQKWVMAHGLRLCRYRIYPCVDYREAR